MIGLGVGIDYALFIVTRFRENYLAFGDVERSVVEAMDTSGRAILLAGTTVVIALLGMFATGVSFMYGLAIASVLAVLLTLLASLTRAAGDAVALRRTGSCAPGRRRRLPRGGRRDRGRHRRVRRRAGGRQRSRWREWSLIVQARPWPLAIVSLAVMVALLLPVFALRLDTSDAGNDPPSTSSRQAFDMLAQGFGAGFNGPLLLVAELPAAGRPGRAARAAIATVALATPDVARGHRAAARASGRSRGDRGVSGLGAAGGGDHRPGQPAAPQVLPPLEQRTGDARAGRRVHGRLDRLLARAVEQAAAVHRDRRRALGAAAVRDVPLAGDPGPGGADEPAQHRRRARRHRRRVPGRLVRAACSASRRAPSSRGSRC